MADVYEQNLASKSTLTTTDYIRVVGSDNVSYKQLVSDVAKKIIENYTGSTLAGSAQSVKSAVDSLNSKTDLSSSYSNLISTTPDSVSIIKKGNVAHIVIQYPSVSIANDTQIGTLPSVIKSTGLSIFKVINRTSGAPIAGTCWVLAGTNAIRYYGTAISSTRVAVEGIMSLDV